MGSVKQKRGDHDGLRWVVALVTLFLSGIPAIVYIVLWAILKPRPTGGVIDV